VRHSASVTRLRAPPPAAEPKADPADTQPDTQPDGGLSAAEDAAAHHRAAQEKAARARARLLRLRQPDADDAAPRGDFTVPAGDDALGRLMAQADSEMEGPENRRRHSTIAHLKAAVAATVAERRVTGDRPAEAEPSHLARYRNDLAMVVRATQQGTARPDRPAPLVLVSEQRIDAPAAQQPAPDAAMPRPRRPGTVSGSGSSSGSGSVSGSRNALQAQDFYDDPDDDEDDSPAPPAAVTRAFAAFAEDLGARGMVAMMEAAAVWITVIEERSQFTRPILMRRLAEAMAPGTWQREDGLRAFGTLLRDGRILRLQRGQFTLSVSSPLLAEAQRLPD
jgi:hypothetical protein